MQYHRVPVREDGVIKENQNTKTANKCHLYSILCITTFFVFLGSIIDLIFSYSFINNCQSLVDPNFMITLDMWLRVSGIYGMSFHVIYCLSILYFFNMSEEQNYTRSGWICFPTEYCFYCSKFIMTSLSIMMLAWMSIGLYMYASLYHSICSPLFFNVYMWSRLTSGVCASTFLIFYSLCVMFNPDRQFLAYRT